MCFVSVFTVLLLQNCSRKVQQHFVLKEEVSFSNLDNDSNVDCKLRENAVTDANNPDHTPIRWVRVNFHYVSDKSDTNNFKGEVGVQYTHDIIYEANQKLANNCQMHLPKGNTTSVLPLRWQFVLAGDTAVPGDDGIYFHTEDSDLAYHIKQGEKENP